MLNFGNQKGCTMQENKQTFTVTIIHRCGHASRVVTDAPLTPKQRQEMREENCPLCRVTEAHNVFGTGGV